MPQFSAPSRAPVRPYSQFMRLCYATPEPEPVDPPAKVDKPAEPVKVTLTEAEVQSRIDAALKTERESAADAKKKADADAKLKAEQEQGQFKTTAETAQRERDEAQRELRTLRTERALSSHLIDKHPDYVKSAQWILPTIPADTKDADMPAAVEKAAKAFVDANPRQQKGGGGVPLPRGDARQSPGRQAPAATGVDGYLARSYPGPASMRRAATN